MTKAIAFSALLLVISCGCSDSHYQPLFVDAQFQQSPPRELRIVPIIDARRNTTIHIDAERQVSAPVIQLFEKAGYKVRPVKWAKEGSIPAMPDSAAAPTPATAMLPFVPDGPEPFVVVRLEQLTPNGEALSRGAIAVVAVWIVEAKSGRVLWMDRGLGNSLYGTIDPLVAVVNAVRSPADDAIVLALDHLKSTLPSPSK